MEIQNFSAFLPIIFHQKILFCPLQFANKRYNKVTLNAYKKAAGKHLE